MHIPGDDWEDYASAEIMTMMYSFSMDGDRKNHGHWEPLLSMSSLSGVTVPKKFVLEDLPVEWRVFATPTDYAAFGFPHLFNECLGPPSSSQASESTEPEAPAVAIAEASVPPAPSAPPADAAPPPLPPPSSGPHDAASQDDVAPSAFPVPLEGTPEKFVRIFSFAEALVPHVSRMAVTTPSLRESLFWTSTIPMGSFFSGIGVLETAASFLNAAWSKARLDPAIVADDIPKFAYHTPFVCDSNGHCQHHLSRTTSSCTHVLKDILDLLEPDVLQLVREVERTQSKPWKAWVQAIWSKPLRKQVPCARHPLQVCELPATLLEWVGSPCQDYSRRGHITAKFRARGRDGPNGKLLLVWIKHLDEQEPPIAGHENVMGFDVAIFHELLSEKYVIISFQVNPADMLGAGMMSRPRKITILIHRVRAVLLGNIEETYKVLCTIIRDSVSETRAADVMWLQDTGSLQEEMFRCMNSNSEAAAKSLSVQDMGAYMSDWTPLLSESEQRSLKEHSDKFRDEWWMPSSDCADVIHHISQSAQHTRASPGMQVPCFTESSSARMWIPSQRRWLSRIEKATTTAKYIYSQHLLGVLLRWVFHLVYHPCLHLLGGTSEASDPPHPHVFICVFFRLLRLWGSGTCEPWDNGMREHR